MKRIVLHPSGESYTSMTWFDVVTVLRKTSKFHEKTNEAFMERVSKQLWNLDRVKIPTRGEWAFLCGLDDHGYITMCSSNLTSKPNGKSSVF